MDKIKVGDWVRIKLVGFSSNSKYVVEKIKEDKYTVIQKEGSYEHRMIIKGNKLEKL